VNYSRFVRIELLESYRSRPSAEAIDTMLCGVWCSGANLDAAVVPDLMSRIATLSGVANGKETTH
jgi:hypothetical protein